MCTPWGSSFDTFFKYGLQIRRFVWIFRYSSSSPLQFDLTRTHKVDNMGLLTVVEDRPTPKAVYNWRVWACACVASFASCMIGYDR